jgi:hypothetical protein
MTLPLRAQYVADVGIGPDTYLNGAGQRIAQIYQTARRGRINQMLAMQIWNILQPIHQQVQVGGLPAAQPAYDQFVVQHGLAIEGVLQATGRGGFGIGQKVVNLFMKDLWGLGIIQLPVELFLHAPLDRIVLSKIQAVPGTWTAWTRVIADGPVAPAITDYLAIQQQIRAFHAACPIPFPSVIQMEQFIWHRI